MLLVTKDVLDDGSLDSEVSKEVLVNIKVVWWCGGKNLLGREAGMCGVRWVLGVEFWREECILKVVEIS